MNAPVLPPFFLASASALVLSTPAYSQEILEIGEPIERSLGADEPHVYALDLAEGQFVFGNVDQIGVDVVVTVTGPDGGRVGSFDGPARGPEPFRFNTAAAGTYEISVAPYGSEEGRYAMRLLRVEPVATMPEGKVDQLFVALDSADSPGAVVGVIQNGEVIFERAYGMADLSHGVPFTSDTRTNIASTSKQFTAYAITLLASRGMLSLDDDVREYLPELPEFEHPVVLRNLLTHTSGYREYLDVLAMAGFDISADRIERQDVIDVVVRQSALQFQPGTEFTYNNTAYGLLALIVERVTGTPFEDWMREEVFRPAGMNATMVRSNPYALVPNRAVGYVADRGEWREAPDLGGAMGDGFVYTTSSDLLRWMAAYASASEDAVRRQMTAEATLASGEDTGYGLGLFLREHRNVDTIEHSGADSAHRADFTYFPDIDAGVVVLTNSPTVPASTRTIADLFFDEEFGLVANDPPEEPTVGAQPVYDAATFDDSTFNTFAGRYELYGSPGYFFAVRRDEAANYVLQVLTSRPTQINPIGPSRFANTSGSLEIAFEFSGDGSVERATIYQGSRELPAFRIPTEPQDVMAADFVGRYYSDELGALYEVTAEGDELVLSHRRLDNPVRLRHSADGRFLGSYPITGVAFARDASGRVTGFVADGPRTSGIQFDRVE